MIEPLLVADPTFYTAYQGFLNEWGDEREPPLYLALADLAQHLILRLESGDTSRFNEVFDVVERWHLAGDHYVREAATIGLLEDLQNTGLYRTMTPDGFLPWLRPKSRKRWDQVNSFWQGGEPIRDD